uniref:Uncharacterized protein n=1 Tax=Helianthus annuus TaxID=4232 RepID=A0A251RU80_HELAN
MELNYVYSVLQNDSTLKVLLLSSLLTYRVDIMKTLELSFMIVNFSTKRTFRLLMTTFVICYLLTFGICFFLTFGICFRSKL